MKAQFTKSINPGQTITIDIWKTGNDVRFHLDESGAVVIDHGVATVI